MPTYNAQTVRDLIDADASADDALIAAMYPLAVRTPRATVVTLATLASRAVWGRTRAKAVCDRLAEVAAAPQTYGSENADDASLALSLINGSGFDPQDPESVDAMAGMVTHQVITQPESDRVAYVYPDPATRPTAQDVADVRAEDARVVPINAVKEVSRLSYIAIFDLCDRRISGTGAQDPTTDEAAAILALKTLLNEGI